MTLEEIVKKAVMNAACRSDKSPDCVVVTIDQVVEEFKKLTLPPVLDRGPERLKEEIAEIMDEFAVDEWTFENSSAIRGVAILKTHHYNRDMIERVQGAVPAPFKVAWAKLGESYAQV